MWAVCSLKGLLFNVFLIHKKNSYVLLYFQIIDNDFSILNLAKNMSMHEFCVNNNYKIYSSTCFPRHQRLLKVKYYKNFNILRLSPLSKF